jgi:hypothetical protein
MFALRSAAEAAIRELHNTHTMPSWRSPIQISFAKAGRAKNPCLLLHTRVHRAFVVNTPHVRVLGRAHLVPLGASIARSGKLSSLRNECPTGLNDVLVHGAVSGGAFEEESPL